jgi:outer membrane biosynthesis protein TonB
MIAAVSDTDDDAPAPIADPRMRRSVAADMKAIFAPLPRQSKAVTAESPPPPSEVAPPKKRGGAARWLQALLAVAILAAILSWLLVPKPQFAPPASQVPPKAAPAMPAAASLPAASQPAPSQPAAQPPSEATAPAGAQPASSASPRTSESDRGTAARKPATPARCGRNASEAWCLRRDIANADDRLRDTYEEAMRAGIDRRLMVAVRDDWAGLRRRVNRDPRALIGGYAELTRELRAAMAGRR